MRACRSTGESFLTRASTSATATYRRISPRCSGSIAVNWSRSRESSLSIEHQGRAVRSRMSLPDSRAACLSRATCCCTADGNSGSSPRLNMARVAMVLRLERWLDRAWRMRSPWCGTALIRQTFKAVSLPAFGVLATPPQQGLSGRLLFLAGSGDRGGGLFGRQLLTSSFVETQQRIDVVHETVQIVRRDVAHQAECAKHQHVRVDGARILGSLRHGLRDLLLHTDLAQLFPELLHTGALATPVCVLQLLHGRSPRARRLHVPQQEGQWRGRCRLRGGEGLAGCSSHARSEILQCLVQPGLEQCLSRTVVAADAFGQHFDVVPTYGIHAGSARFAQRVQWVAGGRKLGHRREFAMSLVVLGTGAISTRRFWARAFSLVLGTRGCSWPNAAANSMDEGMPSSIRVRVTVRARWAESSQLSSNFLLRLRMLWSSVKPLTMRISSREAR